ncbi:MAG TPA: DUF523 domain-containing protein [Deltaproteobacteria bacterium]|nr:DUF523 domain-containing protein [Deltaproteobacteria bacterium]
MAGKVLVSACLLGVRCRYDGAARPVQELMGLEGIYPVPVCPEQMGGLTTPRPSARIVGGDGEAVLKGTARVIDAEGKDVTMNFLLGAQEVCALAAALGVRYAVLKDRSPSCATSEVWAEGRIGCGMGVTAAMLRGMGVILLNEFGRRPS